MVNVLKSMILVLSIIPFKLLYRAGHPPEKTRKKLIFSAQYKAFATAFVYENKTYCSGTSSFLIVKHYGLYIRK